MTREEFMQEARDTAHRILEGKENGIMNLVQQAWAEGKRNAEVETITELVKQAFYQAKQKDMVTVKDSDKWISVKDRLPDKEGQYLCWFGKNVFCIGASICSFVPCKNAFWSFERNESLVNITHWMPIPEAPKEDL